MSTLDASYPRPGAGARRRLATVSDALAALAALSLPLLFILLWSSGYVAGKLGLPDAAPLTPLSLRFGLSFAVLLVLSLLGGAAWPRRRQDWGHLAMVGLLMQVLHFGALYEALTQGLSAGVAGLLIGLMPLATSLGARLWLDEPLGLRQALGLAGGLLGVVLVIAGRAPHASAGWGAHALGLLGLVGLVAGTLYQKRFCSGMDLRSGSCVQMGVSAAVVGLLALTAEGWRLHWTVELGLAVGWLGLVSIGAFSLMFLMIRRGQASQVARLFYLIPAVSAALGFMLLGERQSLLSLSGFVLSVLAVAFSARASGGR